MEILQILFGYHSVTLNYFKMKAISVKLQHSRVFHIIQWRTCTPTHILRPNRKVHTIVFPCPPQSTAAEPASPSTVPAFLLTEWPLVGFLATIYKISPSHIYKPKLSLTTVPSVEWSELPWAVPDSCRTEALPF